VNSAFKLQPRHAYPKVWFYFQKGGNKMKKLKSGAAPS